MEWPCSRGRRPVVLGGGGTRSLLIVGRVILPHRQRPVVRARWHVRRDGSMLPKTRGAGRLTGGEPRRFRHGQTGRGNAVASSVRGLGSVDRARRLRLVLPRVRVERVWAVNSRLWVLVVRKIGARQGSSYQQGVVATPCGEAVRWTVNRGETYTYPGISPRAESGSVGV